MLAATLAEPLPMSAVTSAEKPEKGPKTVPLRLRAETVKMIEEIAEARGQFPWQVVDDLLGADLPATHKAIQPLLKQVREQKRKLERIQEEARKGRAG